MTGIYFSGTGNTRHCVERFVQCFDAKNQAFSIENPEIARLLQPEEIIVFGHPTHFSNAPKMVRDFIANHKDLFRGKRVFIIATMGLFSGDGAGCSARIFRTIGAQVIGALHLKMPDCIGDKKMLLKPLEENKRLVREADEKICTAAERLKQGNPTQDGLSMFHHIAGLFGQRLWFYGKTRSYQNAPKIDHEKCTACGVCVPLCPMKNLKIANGTITHRKRCTMCYRCLSHCPTQAITILGKEVYEQCRAERYV
ncbi:MAG: EFR1 family ferrodoxin [Bacteroidales bacterium]|jgi:NAD-dependent dihydropyrimidine dehydrogenase PreA subunit/flavodoxin|nr:EFR1 family ferrodoxin [Bacteroidales bacterium]